MIYWDRICRVPRSDRGYRIKYWVVCEECGAGRWLRAADIKKFKNDCHWCADCGSRLAHWKGGRKSRPDGYMRVIAPEGHPYPCEMHRDVAYILEHRLVMEQHIGRYLEPGEVVHHLNGNPSDNRIENLVLFANQSEHIRIGHARSNHSAAQTA